MGETAGSWIQWLFNLVGTIATIIVTIHYYSNDHRFKLFFRVWDAVEVENKDGIKNSTSGYTIHVINAGPAITKIKFFGITKAISNFKMKLYNERVKIYDCHPSLRKMLRRQVPQKFDERKLDLDEVFADLFDSDGYTFLKGNMSDELVVKFKENDLSNTIAKMIKSDMRSMKKILQGNDIHYAYTFLPFDGKLNRLRMTISKGSKLYSNIIKKLK